MLVNVKQEHIDNGKVRDPGCCPIALALKDVVKDHLFLCVGIGDIEIFEYSTPVAQILVTPRILNFIDVFDDSDSPSNPVKPEPFSFEADIPAEYLKV